MSIPFVLAMSQFIKVNCMYFKALHHIVFVTNSESVSPRYETVNFWMVLMSSEVSKLTHIESSQFKQLILSAKYFIQFCLTDCISTRSDVSFNRTWPGEIGVIFSNCVYLCNQPKPDDVRPVWLWGCQYVSKSSKCIQSRQVIYQQMQGWYRWYTRGGCHDFLDHWSAIMCQPLPHNWEN